MYRPHFASVIWAAILAAAVVGLLACGGGLNVGRVRPRDPDARPAKNSVKAFELELLTSVVTSDSNSPSWSPDSSRLVFAERYNGRIVVLDVETQLSMTAYEAGLAPASVGDARYNIEFPAFLDNNRILSGPSWGGTLQAPDSWTEVLLTDVKQAAAQTFGQHGARPQVNPETGEVLLEASDGLRKVDSQGQELATYANMYGATWSPDGTEFAALEYPSYYGDNPTLVRVRADGTVDRLQNLAFQATWAADAKGIAFVRPANGRTYFDTTYEFGSIYYYDLESGNARIVSERARSPRFLSKPPLLLFETPNGLGVSDLEETRTIRELPLAYPTPSPNGEYVAGILVRPTQGYYPTVEVAVYAVTAP